MTTFERLLQVTVLYVEDEKIARQSISSFLGRKVGQILVAENGDEGLQLYRANSPGIVVTDLEMPIMNGMEMIRKIREMDAHVPIIVTTAYDDPEHYCPEANRVIQKPICFSDLLQAVEEYAAA